MTPEKITKVPALPPRPADSHKGMFGSILIIGGARGMAGAAGLAGAAALRSGAGLVRIAAPAEVQPTVASFEPSYMTYPLPCDADGLIAWPESRAVIERLLEPADVLAVGPGLGQSNGLRSLVRWLLEAAEQPTVLDADGLNALAGQTELLERLRRPLIVTPHPGEFSRLTGHPTAELQADRIGCATEFAAARAHLVVVLKGQNTVVTDGKRVYINTSGNPGMATAGAGDVLTGAIAALLGQKLPPFEAAQLGVFAHGLAGDIARDQNGEVGMIAGDLVESLADAFDHLAVPRDA
jgi:NAD(P)H-hydrate epimerase